LNGLLVHFVGVLLFILFSNAGLGFYNGALVFQNFFPLFTVATIFSIFFATFLYLKATLFKNDKLALHSDNFLVNWVMGAELNPFIFGFEIKANSYRPGFILEHIFAVSACFQQYQQFNEISSPMLMYQLITFLYLFDCYYYEDGLILMFDIIEEK
jgi:Delta14-sterol reductase